MTAIDFPDSPAVNDVFTAAGNSWTWNGTTWVANPAVGGSIPGPSGAVAFPSNLKALGYSTSGEYWLTGKGNTPYKLYCYYDGTDFWARVANIPRNSVLDFNGYTTTVGSDFGLSNTSLFNLRTNLFGNQSGTDLSVQCRVVGGTFSGAQPSTPGVGMIADGKGLPLDRVFNGTEIRTGTLPAGTAEIEITSFDGSQSGIKTVNPSSISIGNAGDQSGWSWYYCSNSQTSFMGWGNHGWMLFDGQVANSKRARTFFGVTSAGVTLAGNDTWSTAEIYVRI